jgi:citronellol/citronellal dehydrogenase
MGMSRRGLDRARWFYVESIYMQSASIPRDAAVSVLRQDLFKDATCVVTGAGSGIGRAIALRLCALGGRVVGLGRRGERLQQTQELAGDRSGRFEWISCDVRDAAQAQAVIAQVGAPDGIDILVNNAGGQFLAPAAEITANGWASVIDLNLTAIFTLTRAAYPYLSRRGGAVTNISLSPMLSGASGMAHSNAARAGVLGLTRTLALEWARDGVRLNCIGPGVVETEEARAKYGAEVMERSVARTPIKRPTLPAEIAELVAFLSSPAATMITAQFLQIDGGAHTLTVYDDMFHVAD